MENNFTLIRIAALSILILLFLSAFSLFGRHIKQEVADASSGYVDLSGFDFNERLACVYHTSFLYYKNELYEPVDFESGNITTEPMVFDTNTRGFCPGTFGTYRITVKLSSGLQIYGISSYSAMYSQRLFIDGREYPAVGVLGKTVESSVPLSKHYTIYFTPDSDEVDIIIQFSNFVHYDNGGVLPVYIGTYNMISERNALAQQRIHILAGCAFTAFLFIGCMFFFFCRRYDLLWFSLICLCSGIRMLIMNEKTIMIIFPELSWTISIGLEYLALIVLLLSVLLYIHNMFEGALHKAIVWSFTFVCILYGAMVLVTKPFVYTRFLIWFEYYSAATGIYVMAALFHNVTTRKTNRQLEHVLLFIGILIYITLSIINIWIYPSSGHSLALRFTEMGMVVLIIINMLALVLRFSRTEAELDRARRSEKEMHEANLFLDRMSRLKSGFLANISHEMRTPLTVMSSYAGLTSIEIRHGSANDKTLCNLDVIKREASRLGNLVEKLKDYSVEKERMLTHTDTRAVSILNQALSFCGPICQKNKNEILINPDCEDISLYINPESIFQTLVNLIINANRHTTEGTILLDARTQSQDLYAKLSVSDNGEGIDPILLPRVFEKGISLDGSSGLGLAICKEIVEDHRGKIWIESIQGKGTVVYFTLPVSKGAKKSETANNTDC